jgi:hypothetical protein
MPDSNTYQSEAQQFVERMSQEEDVVGDGSATHCLPTISGQHADLKSVTNDTVGVSMSARLSHVKNKLTIKVFNVHNA